MYDVTELETRLNKLLEYYVRSKYLHPRTIKNFIYHFNSLGASAKELTFQYLDNYLHELEKSHELTRNECADLFTVYIIPIAKIYDRDLGFSPKISAFTILIVFIAIAVLLFLLNVPTLMFYLLALILLIYYSYVFFKRTQRKVYGLMF